MKRIRNGLITAALFIVASTLPAQVPQIINYQGRILVGPTNFNGAGQFKFALVNNTGTTTYWSNDGTSTSGSEPTNAVSLTVSNGLYSVLLGDTTIPNMTVSIPASVFSNSDVRLRVWFNDGTTGSQLLSPDQRIASVGYAVIAGTVPDGAITMAKLASGAVGSGQIANGGVGNAQLANGAVNSAKIDNTSVQQRVTGTAPSGSFITGVNANGTITAAAGNSGTITGVTASTGLTGGGSSGNVTLSIANGGVTGLQIANAAVGSSQLLDGSIAAVDIAAGQVAKNINGLTDSVTLAAGSNVSITPSGNTLTIASSGGAFSLNGTSAYYNGGNVGIGTSSPLSALDVRGNLVLEAGGSPGIFTSALSGEQNRYLSIANSPATPTASGLKAGGVLVADDYFFANPGKNDLIVKGNVGIGMASPLSGAGLASSGSSYGGYFSSTNSPSGIGVYGTAPGGSGLNYGGWFTTSSPSGIGVYGTATAATNAINYGVYGATNSPSGYGVYGTSPAFGVYGVASGVGYAGIASGGRFDSSSPSGAGVQGTAASSSGTTYGGIFGSASTGGIGAFCNATAATGHTFGVYGVTNSTGGEGIFGYASASSGTTYALHGLATSTGGRGVFGEATATSGTTIGGSFQSYSTSGFGVFGYAGAASGTTYAVDGQCVSPGGYALYGLGNFAVTGSKAFRIDHPDDPANKYLLHYCTESPQVLNAYRGTVVLDGAGQAVVELPLYFAKINKEPSYTLTAVGAPMPMLHVAQEIDEAAVSAGANAGPGVAAPLCSFRIAGGAPGAKVSWRIEAVRNDLWVRTRGATVEVEKQDLEKGTYQHPELYGQRAEKGLNYDATRERPKPARPQPVAEVDSGRQ